LGVLVAGIFVVPIHDPHGAVGASLDADGSKPMVVAGEEGAAAHLVIAFARAEEFGFALGFVSRANRREAIAIDGAFVDVADEDEAAPFGRPLVTLVNANAGVRSAEVTPIDDGR